MPAERTAMRQVREVLRLKSVGGLPSREIARRLGMAPSTVRATLQRFAAVGLTRPLPEELTDDDVLEAKLFGKSEPTQRRRRHAEPDWVATHSALKRKHVTLVTLWEEYIEREPQGYRYSYYVAAKVMLQAALLRWDPDGRGGLDTT
jgi:transposase